MRRRRLNVQLMNAPQRFAPNPLVEAAIDYVMALDFDARWETNGQGQIIMNPPIGLPHAKRAAKISSEIKGRVPGWQVWPEVGIHTADGIKAPDLAVAPPGFVESVDQRGFLLAAPDLCVEVMSPSNSWEEMRHKALLYLAAGAREVWVCGEAGELVFFDGSGTRAESSLVPGMPKKID
jgi:Uma2 family endonuclease